MSEPHQTSVGSRERERPARHLDLPCRVGRAHSEQEAAARTDARLCRRSFAAPGVVHGDVWPLLVIRGRAATSAAIARTCR